MVFSTDIEVTPSPRAWQQSTYNRILEPFTSGVILGTAQARAGTPIGVDGRLQQSWRAETASFKSGEYQAAIANDAPYAVFGIMGRKPGKFPPFGDNTPLAAWARKRGIVPYLVARKIAREGTERWKAKSNWLGYFGAKPDSVSDTKEITVRSLEAGKPLRNTYDLILVSLNKMVID